MSIAIINTNAGNVTSLIHAITRLGKETRLLTSPDDLSGVSQLVIPGQGHFGSVMGHLTETGWVTAIHNWVAEGKPLLGICVGLQILFEASEEAPGVAGLGIFSGQVTRLRSPKQPMVGWAEVNWVGDRFPHGAAYFVNSFVVRDAAEGVAQTTYGEQFCAVVERGSVIAFQFHPEKSGDYGRRIFEQWLA